MFTALFKKLRLKPTNAVDRKRMDLDERKLFRREMLYQSVRETFLALEVVASMYKFKVMPTDERHHRFVVMIDVAKSFVTGSDSRTKSFAALEKHMRINTYRHFGVLIDGIYWRISETETEFERHSRVTDANAPNAVKPEDVKAHAPQTYQNGSTNMARRAYQAVSEEETNAFMVALSQGRTPPVVHVGDLEYKSDLAPLDDGIRIGGTQYGRLE